MTFIKGDVSNSVVENNAIIQPTKAIYVGTGEPPHERLNVGDEWHRGGFHGMDVLYWSGAEWWQAYA